MVPPDGAGGAAAALREAAGGGRLAEEPRLPGGGLERRGLAGAGWAFPCRQHGATQCQVCPPLFPLSFLFSSLMKQPLTRACFSSCRRIFSLNVVLPPRALLVLVCKPSAGVEASLELKTADASQLAHTNVPDDECRFLTTTLFLVQCLLDHHLIGKKNILKHYSTAASITSMKRCSL